MNDLFSTAALSVSELNAIAGELLDGQFSGLWISGEVSNLTRAASGHLYFSLKDHTAQVRCVLFKFNALRIAPIREGNFVQLRGKVGIYGARGEFQITVDDVQPMGLGQLFEQYERLKKSLQAEGLFDAERKKKLPEMPQKIGIVSSLAAAALHDVLTTLRRRAPHIPVVIYPTAVQGANSEMQIAQAILTANERSETDVLIVCRGGGSLEDLWAFNEECVVRAIAASEIPIVSGVGHETDFTLTDFVTDVLAPTPTAAAELVSPNILAIREQIAQMQQNWQLILRQKYQNAAQKLDFLTRQLVHPKQKYEQQKSQLINVQTALNANFQQILQIKKHQLQAQIDVLKAVSPENALARGFAIVRDTNGKVVRNAAAVRIGQTLTIQLANGEWQTQVVSEQYQKHLF